MGAATMEVMSGASRSHVALRSTATAAASRYQHHGAHVSSPHALTRASMLGWMSASRRTFYARTRRVEICSGACRLRCGCRTSTSFLGDRLRTTSDAIPGRCVHRLERVERPTRTAARSLSTSSFWKKAKSWPSTVLVDTTTDAKGIEEAGRSSGSQQAGTGSDDTTLRGRDLDDSAQEEGITAVLREGKGALCGNEAEALPAAVVASAAGEEMTDDMASTSLTQAEFDRSLVGMTMVEAADGRNVLVQDVGGVVGAVEIEHITSTSLDTKVVQRSLDKGARRGEALARRVANMDLRIRRMQAEAEVLAGLRLLPLCSAILEHHRPAGYIPPHRHTVIRPSAAASPGVDPRLEEVVALCVAGPTYASMVGGTGSRLAGREFGGSGVDRQQRRPQHAPSPQTRRRVRLVATRVREALFRGSYFDVGAGKMMPYTSARAVHCAASAGAVAFLGTTGGACMLGFAAAVQRAAWLPLLVRTPAALWASGHGRSGSGGSDHRDAGAAATAASGGAVAGGGARPPPECVVVVACAAFPATIPARFRDRTLGPDDLPHFRTALRNVSRRADRRLAVMSRRFGDDGTKGRGLVSTKLEHGEDTGGDKETGDDTSSAAASTETAARTMKGADSSEPPRVDPWGNLEGTMRHLGKKGSEGDLDRGLVAMDAILDTLARARVHLLLADASACMSLGH